MNNELSDDELRELAYSAHEEAMAFGLSLDTFMRYFKTIRDRAASPSSKSTKEAELHEALHAAATSLETISFLAGRKSYGDPPIPTYMDTFLDVRSFAANRATVARAALASSSIKEDGERAEPVAPLPYTDAIGRAGQEYHRQFEHAHPLPALWRWQELWDRMVAASSPPSPLGDDK